MNSNKIALFHSEKLSYDPISELNWKDDTLGIVVLNYDAYILSCQNHLDAKQQQSDGSYVNYYSKVEEADLKSAQAQIFDVVNTAYNDGLISKNEKVAMDPTHKGPCKFYELFKVHKTHVEGKAPPERPIVSACGSITENIGKFVQVHLKKFSNTHHSYLQDSPDFLRAIEDQNESGDIEDNDILVTIDVTGLYTNIPQDQGIEACKDILENSDNSDEMNCLVLELLELVLKNNIFEFDGNLFQQNIGTSMGCKPAPDYANIFMAQKIDNKILEKSQLISQDAIKMFKRFLDDIFMRFRGTQKQLHAFLDEINKIHPSIKFTISHATQND